MNEQVYHPVRDPAKTAKIYGTITDAQAKEIGDLSVEDELKASSAILAGIGATAGEDAVALVVKDGEDGTVVPSRFVTLAPGDMGTTLDADGNFAVEYGLPDLDTAYAELQAKKAAEAQPQQPQQ